MYMINKTYPGILCVKHLILSIKTLISLNFSICTVGHRLVEQVENCVKDPVNGSELWNQFCVRKPNSTKLFQNETTEDDYECDEYFADNNVSYTRGVRGMSSGVMMENLVNQYYDTGNAIANSPNETEYNLGGKDPKNFVLVDSFTSWTILVGIFFPSVTGEQISHKDRRHNFLQYINDCQNF